MPTNASIAGGVGRIPLLVARSGTMIAAMIIAVCAAIESGTEYRRLPPIVIDGATNMLSAHHNLLHNLGALDTAKCERVRRAKLGAAVSNVLRTRP